MHHPFARRAAIPLIVTALTLTAASIAAGAPESLVPANWNPRRDASGMHWDIQQQGHVNNGTNSAFSGAMMLAINGNGFSATNPRMTADGHEFVLMGQANNIAVTRRIRVDPKYTGARWIDSFSNPTAGAVNIQIVYQTRLNNQAQVVTDNGTALGTELGPKDIGFLAAQPGNQRPSVAMVLSSPRGEIRPRINNQSNYRFTITYTLTIPAGETRSLAIGLSQIQLNAAPWSQKELDAIFKPFTKRNYLRGVPPDVLRTLVNWSGGSLIAGERPVVWTLPKDLGLEPAGSDLLAIGDQTRLKGTVTWKKLTVHTAFGPAELAVDQVAAIAGPRFDGGSGRVYLRDGQIVAGRIEADTIAFTMTGGSTMSVDPERIDRIVLHAMPGDGEPDDSVIGVVDTFEGCRLALQETATLDVEAITPWGSRRLTLDRLRWLVVRAEEQAGYEVILRDGSRFFTLLNADQVELATSLFGAVRMQSTQLRFLTTEPIPPTNEPLTEALDQPYLLLSSDQRIVGRVELPELSLLTPSGMIPIPPGQVRQFKREASDVPEGEPIPFVADLWDGGSAAGSLAAGVVPVRVDEQTWKIPPSAIQEIVTPRPQLSDEDRARIVNLIRDLGDADWQQRERASSALGEMGALAGPMLRQALRSNRDPEVRQRIERLLEAAP